MHIHYLITTHNHEPFIGAALQSLFAAHEAHFNSPFATHGRILVLDDASCDLTWHKLLTYQSTCGGAMQLERNASNTALIGLNRNRLLQMLAQSAPQAQDLVMFFDGDDLLPSDHLANRLRLFDADPTLDCVGGQLELFHDGSAQNRLIDTFSTDRETAEIANLFECHYYISNTLFKARALRGKRFPEISTSEDWLFFANNRMSRQHCAESTLRYRRHGANLTTPPTPQQIALRRQVRAYQRSARLRGLLRTGFQPSAADCTLLAAIGYQSFRIRFSADQYVAAPHISMPWFDRLARHPELLHDPDRFARSIDALFARVLDANRQSRFFPQKKLGNFLLAMRQAAGAELAAAAASAALAARPVATTASLRPALTAPI